MRQEVGKCILCAAMLALLAASPAMAVQASANLPSTETMEEEVLVTEAVSTEAKESRISKDTLIKTAAGFGVGLAVALLGAAGWSMASKRDRKKQEEQQEARNSMKEQEPFITDDIVTETASVQHGYKNRQVPLMPSALNLPDASNGTMGMVHNVGGRKNQQDTLGTTLTPMGLLAVVSDGMGGLSDGEKVSQQAVMGMFQAAGRVTVASPPYENPLFEMLSEANEQVLQMLGSDQIYKSGATLLAVLADKGAFHWVAVGDSRIYLYCSRHLLQMNHEHIYKKQLIVEAVNRNISFSSVNMDSQRDRLISFLGMGELKHIDGSLRPVEVRQGDKLLLMSDGIFNTISEGEIMRILENTENAEEAAVLMERQVMAAENPKQDNFTCIILDF